MPDVIDVIKGLQEAVDWLSTETSLTVVDQWVVRDALALLKAQEPRVMEFEEVKKLQKNDVVWLEERANNKGAIPVIVRSRYVWPHSTIMVIDFVNSSGCTITIQEEDFCYRDRCWTLRPSDGQMKAVKWDA